MLEGPAIVILWLMSPAIIAIGGVGGALASHAIAKFWATQASKPPEKARDAPMAPSTT
jgi:hypothetical protein